MQNFIFGKVIQRVDSDWKRYFINLGTGDKVLAKGTIKANKIELIPSRVSLKDLEYAEKLKEGKIIGEQELASIRNFFTSAEREKKELKRMQKSDGENMAEYIFRSTAYHEIVNANHIVLYAKSWWNTVYYPVSVSADFFQMCVQKRILILGGRWVIHWLFT